LVLDIPSNGYEARARDEHGAYSLTFFALYLHFPIPTDANQLGEAMGVILITLVHTNREYRMGMPRIDANDRKIDTPELMPKPARHCASLKTDTLGIGCVLTKKSSQGAWL